MNNSNFLLPLLDRFFCKKRCCFSILLLFFLVPIGYLAAWGVHRSRPEQVNYTFFSKDGVEYVTCCQGLSNTCVKWSTLAIDGKPKSSSKNWFSTKTIRLKSTTEFCNLSDDGKLIYLNHGDMSSTLYQYELFNDEPVKTTTIGFVAPVSGHLSEHFSDCSYVSNNKLVSLTVDQLEMRDISTGKVLDTISIQMGTVSDLWPVPGTQSFLTVDNVSKTVRKYRVSDDKLDIIQEWSVLGLHMQPFHRNDETYIANILPDGITIEVRNIVDGSVVSCSTSPISVSRLPLTTRGFLVWKTLGIWTDVFTGKRLAIPSSFVPLFGYTNGNRIVAIRHEETPEMITTKECVVIDTSTDEELLRVDVDPIGRVTAARILKDTGNLALVTDDYQVRVYDFRNGSLVRVIDPLKWGFPLNCAAATLFAIWCIAFLCFAAPIHSHGWIDAGVCIGLFIAYATFRLNATSSTFEYLEDFNSAIEGVLLSSILLTSIWLFLGRNRLFLRTAPVVLVFGLSAGMIDCWTEGPKLNSDALARIYTCSLGVMLPLVILRWSGVRFENLNLRSNWESQDEGRKESSIHLRDIFLFMVFSAIAASIFRWIPLSSWYEIWFDRGSVRFFMYQVAIHAACLAAIGLMAIWTSMSRRNFVIRWAPWLIVLVVVTWLESPFALGPLLIGSSATLLAGLHAYRLRGWRFGFAGQVLDKPQ